MRSTPEPRYIIQDWTANPWSIIIHGDPYPDNPHLYHLDHVTHEHSEDDEGDEVGIRELEHPQQRDEDGLTSNVNDAADAVVVRVLNRAPVKPVVLVKDF